MARMKLYDDKLGPYLDSLVPARPTEMAKMEAYAREKGFPIIGPACGYLCYTIARMVGAKQIFELGSGYGYSTAWFARAVKENGGGAVHHVVWDEDLSRRARGHLGALGYDGMIHYHVSEAIAALKKATGPFDIIFNDIDKHAYPEALPVIADKLRPGGVMLVDNLLWHGAIFDGSDQSDDTRGVRELTQLVKNDPKWLASIVPLRDGLLVAHRQP